MEIRTREVVVTMTRAEAVQLAHDMNIIANHLVEVFAKAGDIDTGDALSDLYSAAHRVDEFRMDLEGLGDVS